VLRVTRVVRLAKQN
jgi:hypothetical protein